METINVVCVPIIAALVYLVIELAKTIAKSEKFNRLIPVISASLGAVLGVVCFYVFPEMISAENVLYAILAGAVSGLVATGADQIYRQLMKGEIEDEEK